jgi:hypothetical protein
MSIANELKKKASELAAQRVSNFDPQIDGAFQCPRCWIEDGRRLRIVTEPSKTLGELNTSIASPVTTKSQGDTALGARIWPRQLFPVCPLTADMWTNIGFRR